VQLGPWWTELITQHLGNSMKSTQKANKNQRGGKGGRRGRDGAVGNTRQIPSDPSPVGDKASNSMSKAVSALVASNQLLALGPSSIVRALVDVLNTNVTMGMGIARAIVKKLMLLLPMDASASDSSTTWSPSGAVMYLVWAAFSALRKAGCFTNAAMMSAFPDFPEECMIPVSWAQFISYIMPYRSAFMVGQYTDTTFATLPAAPTTNAIGVGGNGFCADSSDFAPRIYTGVAGAEPARTVGTGTVWATLFTVAPFMSTVFSRGMNCTPFGSVPAFAPDASAYTYLVTNAQGNRNIASFSPKFNSEIAQFFCLSVNAASQSSSHYGYIKNAPVISGNCAFEFWWVECFQQCSFVAGANLKKTLKTHIWNQAEFAGKNSRYGRVKTFGRGGKNKQPVRYLFGGSIQINTRPWQAMIGLVLQMSNIALTANQAAGLALVWNSALLAKLLPYNYIPIQSGAVPVGAFDPKFADAPMPIALAAVLNTVGPIVVDGRMRYPSLFGVNSIDMRGGWLRYSTVGTVSNAETHWNNIFGTTNVTAITVPLSGTAIFTYSAANFPTTTDAGATPLSGVDLLLESVSAIFGGSNVNLIKPDSHNPVGKANLLVAADVSFPTSADVGTVGTMTTKAVVVSAIGSFKRIAGDELGVACVCPLVYPVDTTGAVSTIALCGFPFKANGTGSQRTSNMVSFVAETVTATVGSSMAQALGSRKRSTYEVGGNTVDISDNGDLFGSIVDSIVGPIFGDSAASFIKSGPLGVIGRAVMPGGLGVGAMSPMNVADIIGVADGVVSSFGVSPDQVAKGMAVAAPFLV